MHSSAIHLELPFTGQALRQAVEQRDLATLLGMATQLRVAGYRVDPQRLAHELLRQGCTTVTDSFGRTVWLQVHVPEAAPTQAVDESVCFRMAA
ncbi:MAG: hypothetical protein J0M20_09880 [Burkholderiales bacterium]|nr:hypothetical protein [Burkholderiales bacterium]